MHKCESNIKGYVNILLGADISGISNFELKLDVREFLGTKGFIERNILTVQVRIETKLLYNLQLV